MSLSHEDVQEILRLLDDNGYTDMTLETENFTLTLQRTDDGKNWTQETKTAPRIKKELTARVRTGISIENEKEKEPEASEAGLIDIRAPMVGTFYRSPNPSADPFVEKGSKVKPDTVIAIIEVMKLMNSVPAGQQGVITELHAQDAQFVEKSQLLMRVKPAG